MKIKSNTTMALYREERVKKIFDLINAFVDEGKRINWG